MIFIRKYDLNILNFLSMLIILTLSMVALYASLSFIRAHENIGLNNIDDKAIWLYWSVIAMGLSSFVFAVMNADSLRKLRLSNKEKIQAVATLENRLSALEMSRDGVLIVDSSSNISYINKSLCLINGINIEDRDKYIGKKWQSIFSGTDNELIENEIIPALNDDFYWVGDFLMYRPDSSTIYTELSLTRLPDGGMIGTIQDVSGRHKAEADKKKLEDQFYQAQKMEAIGRLAGGIAHDFNNILAAMNGYAEFLLDDLEEGSDQHKFANNILLAGVQARDLVDQMLAFSRHSENITEPLDLSASVSETLSMLRATLSKTIVLCDDVLPIGIVISGNSTQISQLIMNLCVNASDAMEDEHGSLNIEIETLLSDNVNINIKDILQDNLPDTKETPNLRIDDLEAGRTMLVLGHLQRNNSYAKLSISDTGTGISRFIMEHIFEPFFTTKPVEKGTGLGLAAVHGIIVSHQGLLIVDSSIGKGTTFELYFPLLNDDNSSLEKGNDEHKAIISSNSKNILLVEDQESVRDVVVEMLRRLGHKTSYAESGLDGLDMIRENPSAYDLIITDYNMPKMTGLEMIQQVHMDLPDLPFIILSGYSEEKMQDMISDHPAIRAVLKKPASKEILAKTIEDITKLK